MSYYDSHNDTLLSFVEPDAESICEFGCGGGGMAKVIRASNPNVYYVGVELMAEPLRRACEYMALLHKSITI